MKKLNYKKFFMVFIAYILLLNATLADPPCKYSTPAAGYCFKSLILKVAIKNMTGSNVFINSYLIEKKMIWSITFPKASYGDNAWPSHKFPIVYINYKNKVCQIQFFSDSVDEDLFLGVNIKPNNCLILSEFQNRSMTCDEASGITGLGWNKSQTCTLNIPLMKIMAP